MTSSESESEIACLASIEDVELFWTSLHWEGGEIRVEGETPDGAEVFAVYEPVGVPPQPEVTLDVAPQRIIGEVTLSFSRLMFR